MYLEYVLVHFIGICVIFSASKVFTDETQRGGVFPCLTCTALKQKYYLYVGREFPVVIQLLVNFS